MSFNLTDNIVKPGPKRKKFIRKGKQPDKHNNKKVQYNAQYCKKHNQYYADYLKACPICVGEQMSIHPQSLTADVIYGKTDMTLRQLCDRYGGNFQMDVERYSEIMKKYGVDPIKGKIRIRRKFNRKK